jgi:hypothetical protein
VREVLSYTCVSEKIYVLGVCLVELTFGLPALRFRPVLIFISVTVTVPSTIAEAAIDRLHFLARHVGRTTQSTSKMPQIAHKQDTRRRDGIAGVVNKNAGPISQYRVTLVI